MKRLCLLVCLFITLGLSAQTWSAFGLGTDYRVRCFTTFNSDLYMGGDFSQVNGIPAQSIAKFNGTTWSNLGSSIFGAVEATCFYNNELYTCGMFSGNVAKWNGSTWSIPGGGVGGGTDFALSIAVYNGDLYVGGKISGGTIKKWNGSAWSSLGTGISGGGTPYVRALAVYNGELYVGGSFTNAGGIAVNDMAKWNGSSWSSVGTGGPTGIWELLVYNGELYVGHGSAPRVSKWNGSTWSGVGSMNDYVYALAEYNGELYAGGDFTLADGSPADHVAKWNGTNWSALGSGTDTTVLAMCAYNGDLYVGGVFTNAGGISANYIAKWNNPIGVDENSKCDLGLYPNPSNDAVRIECEEGEVGMFDALGRVVNVQRLDAQTLHVRDLPNGIYFLRFNTSSGVFTRKIAVQH